MKMTLVLAMLCSSWTVLAATNAVPLVVGAPAPGFTAVDSSGQTNRLADFRGKWVVLYFYPKAFAADCTSEACSLRDGYGDILAVGAVILGVSLDPVSRLQEFKEKYRLPFELLSDEDKRIARAYDSLAFGGLYAKRRTFIIDPGGRIARIMDKVNVKAHDSQVRNALQMLEAARKTAVP
jgi:peroxiredoxin Q/BCP